MTSGRPSTDDSGSTVLVTWHRDDVYRLRVGLPVCVGLMFFGLAAIMTVTGRPLLVLEMVTIGLAELGLAGCFALWTSRFRAVLTLEAVDSIVGRRVTRVPLVDIRGVVGGGRYWRSWSTWLLLDDGRSVRLAAPAFVFLLRTRACAAPDAAYWRSVADLPAAARRRSSTPPPASTGG